MMRCRSTLPLVICLSLGTWGTLPAQEDDAGSTAAQEFSQVLGEWKTILGELRELRQIYASAEQSEFAAIELQHTDLIANGEQLLPRLRAAAVTAYTEAPNADREVTRFLVKMISDDVFRDDYEPAAELAQLLADNGCKEKEVHSLAGVSAFATNDFAAAAEHFQRAADEGSLTKEAGNFNFEVENYKKYWEEEEAIRAQEAAADDLPRMKMTTSKGDIIVELFENEAPQAVANFISLVNDGFYTNLKIHRVLPGFMAQMGCPKGDGTGGPGYNIFCECHQENHRKHFRGSLSMAHAGRDTGGSQFFLTFVPTPHLNGRHSVFGRVIEGMELLAQLQRIDPSKPSGVEPDVVISAEVIRVRDHPYEPTKVE